MYCTIQNNIGFYYSTLVIVTHLCSIKQKHTIYSSHIYRCVLYMSYTITALIDLLCTTLDGSNCCTVSLTTSGMCTPHHTNLMYIFRFSFVLSLFYWMNIRSLLSQKWNLYKVSYLCYLCNSVSGADNNYIFETFLM